MRTFERIGLRNRSQHFPHHAGIVTQHPIATSVAAEILTQGGSAFDAAIAASFVLAVVEPYASGLGGVGLGIVRSKGRMTVFDAGPVAPKVLDPKRYQIVSGSRDSDLFGWPSVAQDANLEGAPSICVPGMVSLMQALYDEGSRLAWSRLVAPASRLARDGFAVDWLLCMNIAQEQSSISRFAASADIFLPDGLVPYFDLDVTGASTFRQPHLADTLDEIAVHGPRSFYSGRIGHQIVQSIKSEGGTLGLEDLSSYSVKKRDPLCVSMGGADIWLTDDLNGGPTIAEILQLYRLLSPEKVDWGQPLDLAAWITSGTLAFEDRLTLMGHAGHWKKIPTFEHAQFRVSNREIGEGGTLSDGSTTYLAVADDQGNAVSVNLTLLSRWGSKFTVPGLGILMNNGIMWFDPEPGRPNSIAPGAMPLANMAPVIFTRDGDILGLAGASGGRRIIGAVSQILGNILNFGMHAQNAAEAPRIEFSMNPVRVDSRLDPTSVAAAEQASGTRCIPFTPNLGGHAFASPAVLVKTSDGNWQAGVDTMGLHSAIVGPY